MWIECTIAVAVGVALILLFGRQGQRKHAAVPTMLESHHHSLAKNIVNGALVVAGCVPWLYTLEWMQGCDPTALAPTQLWSADGLCHIITHNSFLGVNVLFVAFVNVLFWVIGLLQGNFWLIDPFWTLLPPLIGFYFKGVPGAVMHDTRSAMVLAMVLTWSVRLTHSYLRREEWNFGLREDWRFTEMAQDNPTWWWLLSFGAVFLSQQVLIVGISMPLWAVHQSSAALTAWDAAGLALTMTGMVIAFVADTQLYAYVRANTVADAEGRARVPVLRHGLWRYSRHPNYFGEQLFWWGFACFAVSVGWTWMLIGPFINSLLLAYVTVVVERKMVLSKPERRQALLDYMRQTSGLVPLPVGLYPGLPPWVKDLEDAKHA